MSKRSRRRARRDRLRQRVDLRPLTAALSQTGQYVAAMRDAMLMVGRAYAAAAKMLPVALDAATVRIGAASNAEWRGAVLTAIDRRDAVPLLVYADWLDERGRAAEAAAVRRLGEAFAARAWEFNRIC